MLDDEPIGFDRIDIFRIIINGSVFCFNKFNPLTITGIWGIGRITLAFYNLAINPTSCNSETTTIIDTSLPCECVCVCVCLAQISTNTVHQVFQLILFAAAHVCLACRLIYRSRFIYWNILIKGAAHLIILFLPS